MTPTRKVKTMGLPGVKRAARAIAEHFLGEDGGANLDAVAEIERLIEEHAGPSDLAGVLIGAVTLLKAGGAARVRGGLIVILDGQSLLETLGREDGPGADGEAPDAGSVEVLP